MNTHPVSRSRRAPIVSALAFLVCGVLAQACATSGPPAPTGPIELDKTRWKLVALAGQLDGRVIEFQKHGPDAYSGKLVVLGRRLQDVVGLKEGFEMFQIKRKGENQYEGVFKAVEPNGNQADKEVFISVTGNTFTWNQENATWERQD